MRQANVIQSKALLMARNGTGRRRESCACSAGLCCVCLVLASLAVSFSARADALGTAVPAPALRVVLMTPEPAFERALRTALGPWAMRVSALSRETPGAVMPGSAARARLIAQAESADALIWISSNSEGRALWVYDVRSDTVSARPVPDPPLSAASAAALALSVKTVLRAPLETPLDQPLAAPPPAPPSTGAPDVPSESEAQQNSEPGPAPRFQLALQGATRLGAAQPAATNLRYGLELRWAPLASQAAWAPFWLGVGAEASMPRSVRNQAFRGEYWELAPVVSLGVSAYANRWLVLGVNVAASIELASLSGSVLANGEDASHSRFSPWLRLRPELGFSWGRASLLLQPGAGVLLRRQRYFQGGDEVLQTKLFWWTLGAGIAVRLD
jgi:hypothetical protein